MARIRDVAGLTSLACAFAMGAASACTSFSTDDPPTPSGDAGDESRAIPPTDGAALDGSAAAADGDAARIPTSCAEVDATFCDDFDHGEPLAIRWDVSAPTNGSAVVVADAQARSLPLSLHVSQKGEAAFVAFLAKQVPTFVDRFSISFDVLFAEAPSGNLFLLQTFLTPNSGGENSNVGSPWLASILSGSGVALHAWNWKSSDGGSFGQVVATIPVGAWRHIAISFEPTNAGGASETFEIEGNPAVTRTIPRETATTMPSLFLGAQSGSAQTNIYYDNVVIHAH